MSGGFFRGTSAVQDTRFSNKQAKLLKSQKFAPELEHLVNGTKVKMDVMKPWIANRVTELLGFEDEVLINFIYGLLDGKEVNGKEVQISLTGFMEKNTGKFMKELWTLLLSAQNNASGVPQQFLDAKEEETRKKKAEADRIADEIRRKRDKESRELEHEQLKKMDGEDEAKNANADQDRSSGRLASKASNARSDDREDMGKRNEMRGRNRRSRSRSISKSFSSSRSHSYERRHRSRSISRSPRTRERSVPSEMFHRSRKRSLTPCKKYSPRESRSPPRRRSSYYRRRSRSRSVSPMRRSLHSPIRYRSRSPVRRRSMTPVRRRRSPSPLRRRSPSPMRRRAPSPKRRRLPSPKRQRLPSPKRWRSPSPKQRRSPLRHDSTSPMGHESPSPRSRRSSSQIRQKSSSPTRRRSPLAVARRSPSPMRHRSQSPVRCRLRSPVRQTSPSPVHNRSLSSPPRRQQHRSQPASRLRSPPEARGRSPVTRHRRSVTPSRRSSEESSSPSHVRSHSLSPVRRSPRRYPDQSSKSRMRSSSLEVSPTGQVRNQVICDRHLDSPRGLGNHRQHDDSIDSREQRKENYNAWDSEDHVSKYEEKRSIRLSSANNHDDSTLKGDIKSRSYAEGASTDQTSGPRGHSDSSEIRNKDRERQRERNSGKEVHSEISDQMSPPLDKATLQGEKEKFCPMGSKMSENKSHACSDIAKDKDKQNIVSKPLAKVDNQQGSASLAASEESEKHGYKLKERRNKRSERHEMDSESESYYSEAEERKEAKRRRKEKRRLRKEERRRRREERQRRKEERHMERLKVKSHSTDSSPLDNENYPSNVDSSDCEQGTRKKSRALNEERGKEQKKLETELRMKALESFKAKKGAK